LPEIHLRSLLRGDLVMAVLVVAFGLYAYNEGSRYLQTIVVNSAVLLVMAYSWNVISGYTRYFSFGQVAFYGIGAYATAVFTEKAGLGWQEAVLLAIVVSAVAAVPIGWVLLRLRGIYFALGTLALYLALLIIATNTGWVGKGQGMALPLISEFNTVVLLAVVAALISIAVAYALAHSRLGLRAQALGADEDAIKALGVRTMNVKLSMFVISAALAGMAGAVASLNAGFITPTTAFSESINTQSIVYTLIGGVGTVWGPVLGTGVAQAIITQFADNAAREVEIALGLLIVVIVTLTPGGLVGLLNRVGILPRAVMLRRRAGRESTLAVGPGWLRRFGGNGAARVHAPLLEASDVTVKFSGVTAVDHVDLRVATGEFVAVIGANGAGKTTLFNAISGYVPKEGSVRLAGEDVSRMEATNLARAGISRTFQIPRLANQLTVWENVLLGSLLESGRAEAQDRAWLIVEALGLTDVAYETVEHLGPGTRRRVEIARVVATRPRVILLDEALAGMSSEEIEEVAGAVAALRDWGVEGIVAVEHVLSAVRGLADRMMALDFGKVVAEGTPDEVLEHEKVVDAYLGTGGAAEGHEPAEDAAAPASVPADIGAAALAPAERSTMVVEDLVAGYGQVRVLWNVDLTLAPGEFIGVLGASGAGKTTLCRALTGACTVHEGSVSLDDEPIAGKPAHVVARMGVSHVPSSRELFPEMSVEDNLRLGAVEWRGETTERLLGEVLELFEELVPLRRRDAGSLSGGQQQMVAIGRALMREPSLLILDEPSTGLAPIVVKRLMKVLRVLADRGVAVMVVEQNALETLRAVDRAYVLQEGRIVFKGTAEKIRDDPRLAGAYLGADAPA
jgi:ABC-type branched-subunit amino acid transport system ATPase component/ABC-type branched-subunit amino acid transport system permease subunit